jgi:hypothetical protein
MRGSAADLVLTTSATRIGVEACADFVDAVLDKVQPLYVPIPREVCEGRPADLGSLGWILEPLLYLYHEREGLICYGGLEELRLRAFATARLAGLAVKAKVFGKIDLDEWDRALLGVAPEPPRPSLAIGYFEPGVVICGAPIPNPLELAASRWRLLDPEQKMRLAKYIVQFLDIGVSSINIDEAYLKLAADEEYKRFARAVIHHMGN